MKKTLIFYLLAFNLCLTSSSQDQRVRDSLAGIGKSISDTITANSGLGVQDGVRSADLESDSVIVEDTTGTVIHQTEGTEEETGGLPSSLFLILSIVAGLYEVIIRLVPTVGNYSILSLIMKIIATVIPNKKAPPPDTKSSLSLKTSTEKSTSKLREVHEVIN